MLRNSDSEEVTFRLNLITRLKSGKSVYDLLTFVKNHSGGTWVALWVKHLILDFYSGHDLRVMGLSPALGSVLGIEPA